MAGFEQTVLFGAIIILIIALIVIGFALSKSTDQAWPPMIPSCPDYWTVDGSGNNGICVNVKNLGTCPQQSGQKFQTINFNVAPFNSSNP